LGYNPVQMDNYMRSARKCNLCGYLTLHPLIYCEKCPGRFAPTIITKEDFLKEKTEYARKEREEGYPFGTKEAK